MPLLDTSEVVGAHSGIAEDSSLLGCNCVVWQVVPVVLEVPTAFIRMDCVDFLSLGPSAG